MLTDTRRIVAQVGKIVFINGIPKFKVFYSREGSCGDYAILTFPEVSLESSDGFNNDEVEYLKSASLRDMNKLRKMAFSNGFIFMMAPLCRA